MARSLRYKRFGVRISQRTARRFNVLELTRFGVQFFVFESID